MHGGCFGRFSRVHTKSLQISRKEAILFSWLKKGAGGRGGERERKRKAACYLDLGVGNSRGHNVLTACSATILLCASGQQDGGCGVLLQEGACVFSVRSANGKAGLLGSRG